MLKWSSNFPRTDNTVTLGQGREGWENYLLLEKIDEAKSTTWKQYAGSNRLSCHCHRVFSLQVPAIYGVDTRMLTKIIRDKVWSSSLAECVPLLISPRAWRTHWSAEEESWSAPSCHFYVTVLHSSGVVPRTESWVPLRSTYLLRIYWVPTMCCLWQQGKAL